MALSWIQVSFSKCCCLSPGSRVATVVIRALKSLLWNIVTERLRGCTQYRLLIGQLTQIPASDWLPGCTTEWGWGPQPPIFWQFSSAAVTTAHLSLLIIIISNIPICCWRGRALINILFVHSLTAAGLRLLPLKNVNYF